MVKYYADGSVAIDSYLFTKGPSQDYDTTAAIGVGRVQGTTCQIEHEATSNVASLDEYWLWNSDLPNDTSFNCVVAMVRQKGNPNVVYDAQVGRLTNHYIQPRLAVGAIELLNRKVKRLNLVRKAPQHHWVTVRNNGKLVARNVVLSGKGPGLRMPNRKLGRIEPGDKKRVKVPIRLVGKQKSSTLTLTARGSGLTARKKLPVKAIKAPARAKSGAWKGTRNVTFTVKNNRVQRFRIVGASMRCGGGFAGFPTYRSVTLNFPKKVKIPRHGFFQSTKKYRKGDVWYNATLSGKIVGGKLTQGRYTYSTAGSCFVSEGFTARR